MTNSHQFGVSPAEKQLAESLADNGVLILAGWNAFQELYLKNWNENQINFAKFIFYTAAQHLFSAQELMTPSHADIQRNIEETRSIFLKRMKNLREELAEEMSKFVFIKGSSDVHKNGPSSLN